MNRMPRYEFRCDQCNQHIELDLPVEQATQSQRCPHCGNPLKRVFSVPGIRFVGPGFHVNDYPKR